MIPVAATVEEEAEFYRAVFRLQTGDFPKPNILPCSTVKEPYQAKIVCYRCGCIGHASNSCSTELPKIDELEVMIQHDISSTIAELESSGNYLRDEFGCVLKDSDGISSIKTSRANQDGSVTPVNWATHRFCLNCGEEGHTFSKCHHIPVGAMLSQIKEHLYDGVARDENAMFSLLKNLMAK